MNRILGSDDNSVGYKISKTAIELSWDKDADGGYIHGPDDPKESYIEAMKAIGTYYPWEEGIPIGASCDQFVGTVMRYSKVDPDFYCDSAVGGYKYMKSHPEMYTEIDLNDLDKLQSGDIIATSTEHKGHGHIWIYLKINGRHGKADASCSDRTSYHGLLDSPPSPIDKYGRKQSAFRRIR